MTGDFAGSAKMQEESFRKAGIVPGVNGRAIDLGAGNGIQSAALARLGFRVKAIDFNMSLLEELRRNTADLSVEAVEDDILNVGRYRDFSPELITCCGDTIAHLDSFEEMDRFIDGCYATLIQSGRLYLTFRDYSEELHDTARFIPVRSGEERILTCFLDFYHDHVRVTDLLHERINGVWAQKASSYKKIRITPDLIEGSLVRAGFEILSRETGPMKGFLARKP